MSFSRGASRARSLIVSRASLSPETAENVVMQISGVIKFGAPMYNKGDARGCALSTGVNLMRDDGCGGPGKGSVRGGPDDMGLYGTGGRVGFGPPALGIYPPTSKLYTCAPVWVG